MSKFAEVYTTYVRRVKARNYFWQLWLPKNPNQVMGISRQLEISDEEFNQLKGFRKENVIPFLCSRHKQMIRKGWRIKDNELRHIIEEHN